MPNEKETAQPPYRLLRGYTLDPGFSTRLDTMLINESVYKIQWEKIEPGPVGEYIEVVDHDPASNCFYQPVNLNETNILAENGLSPSEGNPQFHQQFVYTVSMKTINHFERALGRKIIWRHRNDPKRKDSKDETLLLEFNKCLRIYPHALREPNAYYDPEKNCLAFGYFEAAPRVQGSNFPGGVVFTCLSPDIVAHETVHAILDSLHERFTENTNRDVPAFHEAFADIIALLQRFTFTNLVEHELYRSKGNLDDFNLLGELATQFGEALAGGRGALRSAIGAYDRKEKKWVKYTPDPKQYQDVEEPHDRGAILVATVFDAFLRLYHHRTADLIRIASNGTGVLPEGNLNPDLVKRLAQEATDIAEHLLHICIRALDYCPPIDITFGNYLRALITADLDVAPEDEAGYRIALIEAFRARGIFPDRVNTLSVESLKWNRPVFNLYEQKVMNHLAKFLRPSILELIDENDREQIYLKQRRLQAEFHRYLHGKKEKDFPEAHWERFLKKLGLTSKPIELEYEGKKIRMQAPPIEVHKIRPTFKHGREGNRKDQVIVVLSQTIRPAIDGEKVTFRGGSTLILNLSDLKDAEYVISKNISSERRFTQQVDYQVRESGNAFAYAGSTYANNDHAALNFKNLHFFHQH